MTSEVKKIQDLLRARAAFLGTLGSLHLQAVHGLNERELLVDNQFVGGSVVVGRLDGQKRGVLGAWAALSKNSGILTSGFLASKLALGFGAQGGGLALPCALGLLAKRRAVGLRGSASGAADSGTADSLAGWAVFLLAHILGASDRAHGFLAVDFAFGAFGRFAVHLALGSSADWVTLGRADRVIAQPFALRMALSTKDHTDQSNKQKNNSHFLNRKYVCI